MHVRSQQGYEHTVQFLKEYIQRQQHPVASARRTRALDMSLASQAIEEGSPSRELNAESAVTSHNLTQSSIQFIDDDDDDEDDDVDATESRPSPLPSTAPTTVSPAQHRQDIECSEKVSSDEMKAEQSACVQTSQTLAQTQPESHVKFSLKTSCDDVRTSGSLHSLRDCDRTTKSSSSSSNSLTPSKTSSGSTDDQTAHTAPPTKRPGPRPTRSCDQFSFLSSPHTSTAHAHTNGAPRQYSDLMLEHPLVERHVRRSKRSLKNMRANTLPAHLSQEQLTSSEKPPGDGGARSRRTRSSIETDL